MKVTLNRRSNAPRKAGLLRLGLGIVVVLGLLALLTGVQPLVAEAGGGSICTDKCGFTCDAIANGPFSYTNESGSTSATFIGSGGSPVSLSFDVIAPNATGDIIVFPGQGQNACTGAADAIVGVLEIAQVADANGNQLATPIDIGEANPSLFAQIAGAFQISLNGGASAGGSVMASFTPGLSDSVGVQVGNPNVDPSNYGEYSVKLAAQAPGAGIGVGAGVVFDLTLQAASVSDMTPCVVTINTPTTSPETLGPIAVSVEAYDPSPGSGLASVTASISSAGAAVSNVDIPLQFNSPLPGTAGVTVTGTGSYIPIGGTGAAGTTDAVAFTTSSRSGIGTYTVTASCTDIAGNMGQASVTFAVNYAVSFTQNFVPSGCNSTHVQSCQAMLQFDVNRSGTTSDGAFMFDHTARVNLVGSANAGANSCATSSLAVQSHQYGTGSIGSYTQISATPAYQTKFDGSNTSVVPFGSYAAQVCFVDVDGNPDLQATSPSMTF